MDTMTDAPTFAGLGLPESLLETLNELGYQQPSPIQAQAIPALLAGRDLLGQAQTGTGKTAAFALPILSGLDNTQAKPQALILAPTRELAMQVAQSFERYSEKLGHCRVLAVYGGQSMRDQLTALRRGVQIVVGTPGRLLDHLNRKTLDLSALRWVVMDEADEMLRMGFIDDVEAILGHTGGGQQTALFSATMPPRIKNIADRYLREPEHIRIAAATATVASIDQYAVMARQREKPAALARLLAAEDFDAAIIFCRTRESTTELAELLSEQGHACTAINGDLGQAQREQTIQLLKQGKIDILVATDVAARGLDVERISHVINYDLPNDPDTYVHRIGRTGRAGRSGRAILLVDPRDRRALRGLEQATRQPLKILELAGDDELHQLRRDRFRQQLAERLANAPAGDWQALAGDLGAQLQQSPEQLAGSLLALLADQHGLNAALPPAPKAVPTEVRDKRPRREFEERSERGEGRKQRPLPDQSLERYRLAVGRSHQIKVGDIVGAIANEAGIDSNYIGRIQLYDDYSTVDLPPGMPREVLAHLKTVRVRSHPLNISRHAEGDAPPAARPPRREERPRREFREDSSSAPRRKLALKH